MTRDTATKAELRARVREARAAIPEADRRSAAIATLPARWD